MRNRLKLMRHAMAVLFGGRPTLNACWTYITCEKEARPARRRARRRQVGLTHPPR